MKIQTFTGPFEFVVGTNDLHSTTSFLRAFGYDQVTPITIDRNVALSLYGCAEAQCQTLLSRSETETAVRLVLTNAPAKPMQEFEAGGHGIDFYTTAIETAIDRAVDAGGSRPTPVSWTIDTGRKLTEARIVSPDGSLAVFCVSYAPGGIPTILDKNSDLMFSEVALTSWIIPRDLIEEEFRFWSDAFGYRNIRRTMLSKEAMVELMKLPHPEEMGCSMYADDRPRCPVDLLWYPERDIPLREDWPLRPGLYALGFKQSFADAPELPGAISHIVRPVASDRKVATITAGRSPGGIRYQIAHSN